MSLVRCQSRDKFTRWIDEIRQAIANMLGMTFLRKILTFVFALLLISQASAQNAPVTAYPLATLPLPQLNAQTIELRVAHVINPRLPRMSDAQIALMLDAMARATSEHLGIEVRFVQPVEIPIAQVFAGIPPKFTQFANSQQHKFRSLFARKSTLARAYAEGFAQGGEPLEEMAMFAQRKGLRFDKSSFAAFGKDAANYQLARMHDWQKFVASDGKSVIDDQAFHEYTLWNHIGYGNLPFELVITNQIIASVEYSQPSIHTAIRGGYTNGFTSFSTKSRLGSFAAWSTFALTSNDTEWLRLREGESYTAEEAAQLAGTAAVHELGHLLLHLMHPFGQKGCIMDPVPMFAYRAWAAQLSAKDCPLSSSAAMKPGAYRFTYLLP